MSGTFVSSFTPSLMEQEALESLLVKRSDLLARLQKSISEAATSASKFHTLLVGPRGIGKTHVIAVLYHRLKAIAHLRDRLAIAWLREEEWGVSSFLDMIIRILRALASEMGDELLSQRIETVYQLSRPIAERSAVALLTSAIKGKTLLLLTENLDDLFAGLGDIGQKQLRALIQENATMTVVATAQSLFSAVTRRTSPFYGFFRIEHLTELSLDDAAQLVANTARLRGDMRLAAFALTPVGRARLRAVHHLAGGNPRIYVIFSQFLTRSSLDDLVPPVLKTIDDLTPYYQSRMAQLSVQQRKIVDSLAEAHGAFSVKEIASKNFITSQTASSQLKQLRENGYVRARDIGRESYYELREPLMRLCLAAKRHRSTSIALLVDFLRLWYSVDELKQRLAELPGEAPLERKYLLEAITIGNDSDPRIDACLSDFRRLSEAGEFAQAVTVLEELIAMRGSADDWGELAHCLAHLGRWDECLRAADATIVKDVANDSGHFYQAWALDVLGRHDEALAAFDRALALHPTPAGWYNRGGTLFALGRFSDAVASYDRSLEMDEDPDALVARARALQNLDRNDDALSSLEKALELRPTNSRALTLRGFILGSSGRLEEAKVSFERALDIDREDAVAWRGLGMTLRELSEDSKALEALDRTTTLAPQDASAWATKGSVLARLGRVADAITALCEAIRLHPGYEFALHSRGLIKKTTGDHAGALVDYEAALGANDPCSQLNFDYAYALFRSDRWADAILAMDNALARADDHTEFYVGDISNVIAALADRSLSEDTRVSRVTELVLLYAKHSALARLGAGLTSSFESVRSSIDDTQKLEAWSTMWHGAGAGHAALELPLRLVDAAVRHASAKSDRILMEFPEEERRLLQQMLGLSSI